MQVRRECGGQEAEVTILFEGFDGIELGLEGRGLRITIPPSIAVALLRHLRDECRLPVDA